MTNNLKKNMWREKRAFPNAQFMIRRGKQIEKKKRMINKKDNPNKRQKLKKRKDRNHKDTKKKKKKKKARFTVRG